MTAINADDIIKAARSQLGVKFRHQGRIAGQVLDCAGLVAYVADTLGVAYEKLPTYGRIPHKDIMRGVLDAQPGLKCVRRKQPGDILLMRFADEPQHVAIYTGDTIIHSYAGVGMVCEHRLDEKWENRIVAIYRFRDLN